jgi:hypothetical protein
MPKKKKIPLDDNNSREWFVEKTKEDAIDYVKLLLAKADGESAKKKVAVSKKWTDDPVRVTEEELAKHSKMAVSKRWPEDPLGVKSLGKQIKEMQLLLEKKNMAFADAAVAREKQEQEEMETLKKKL